MKGPYERLKYDLRRVFECPRCRRRVKTPGQLTSYLCGCASESADQPPAVMMLVEDGVRRVDGHALPGRGTAIVSDSPDPTPATLYCTESPGGEASIIQASEPLQSDPPPSDPPPSERPPSDPPLSGTQPSDELRPAVE